MAFNRCQKNGKPGYRCDNNGKCYTYTTGDKESRERAKRLAEMQGRTKKTNKKKGKKR